MTHLEYIPRIRDYYQTLGYGKPYGWKRYDSVPFAKPQVALNQATLGIVTTAAPFQPGKGDQGAGAAYNGLPKFYSVYAQEISPAPVLGISHIAYDRTHTTAADQGTYFPLKAFETLASGGEIGTVSQRFYGLPTNRSQRVTEEVDAIALRDMCKEDGVDVAVLVPNCPVCHQSCVIAAHALEAAGIPTVVMGCARDIVEFVGAPRLLFSNFPLGNGAGLPGDPAAQLQTARLALELLTAAKAPRTTRQSPLVWSGAADWQKDYSNAKLLSPEELESNREEFDKVKEQARAIKAAG